jgi:hypothetical protein
LHGISFKLCAQPVLGAFMVCSTLVLALFKWCLNDVQVEVKTCFFQASNLARKYD